MQIINNYKYRWTLIDLPQRILHIYKYMCVIFPFIPLFFLHASLLLALLCGGNK